MVKQEHYIPRFYLKRFSVNNRLSVYDIQKDKLFKTNINKIACENYFYDLDYKSLKEVLNEQKMIFNIPNDIYEDSCNDTQFVEKALSGLEDRFSNLLYKFEKNFKLIEYEEFLRTLFLFIYVQSLRTRSFRKGLENIASQTKSWIECLNNKVINFPIELESEEIAKRNQAMKLLSPSMIYKRSYLFFEKYDFFIGVNKSYFDFIISDNPLLNMWLGFNDICFPINSRLSIIMQVKSAKEDFKICKVKSDENKIINLGEKEVLKYNILQHNSNARFLFGSEISLNKYLTGIKLLQLINKK